jgi:hypothetical protein
MPTIVHLDQQVQAEIDRDLVLFQIFGEVELLAVEELAPNAADRLVLRVELLQFNLVETPGLVVGLVDEPFGERIGRRMERKLGHRKNSSCMALHLV